MPDPAAQVITRFAPSPTGQLHLGHLYSAHIAHQLAQSQGGQFLLRFEDIDTTRVRDPFYQAIEDDLDWAGIEAPKPYLRQSERLDAYSLAIEQLKSLGVLYPCFCSRKDIQRELAHITNAPHGSDGPHYPGTCRTLGSSENQQNLAAGKTPSWRLDCAKASKLTGTLGFHDTYFGETPVNPGLLGDIILARKDIGTSYHIAVVVDDAYQNITDVVRGEDLLDSTHIHRVLQKLLNLPQPRYHHHPLVTDDAGERLAKRHEALALQSLREDQKLSAASALEMAKAHLISIH